MFRKIHNFRSIIFIVIVAEVLALSLRHFLPESFIWLSDAFVIFVNLVIILSLHEYFEEIRKQRVADISAILGKDAQAAFLAGEMGLLTLNSNFEITWVSELLDNRAYHVIGQKIMNWLPETRALFNNELDNVTVTINDHIYEVSRQENSLTLLFKDVTQLRKALDESEKKQIVLGLIHFDDYEETTQYEDEHRIALIDSKIRQAVYRWANDRGILIKRLKNNRMLMVLTEELYLKAFEEQFSILEDIRNAAMEIDVAITLSMAFARGIVDFPQLEKMVIGALALAQSHGGDQVAIKTYGEDVVYMGGSSEAQEKRSKVRARVIAQTLKEVIINASNVIIMGHKEMDFDCFGSALAMSRIVSAYKIPVAVLLHGGMEAKLNRAFKTHRDDLSQTHNFIAEHQLDALVKEQTLLIMVDHHQQAYASAPNLLSAIKHIVVIDHHRRNQDFTFNPLLVYTETAASSTSEMVTELIPYHQFSIELSPIEATFILTGVVIDTNRFRNRTGSRTFEVAALLKQYGADSAECDGFLKDTYQDFQQKAQLLRCMKTYPKGIVIAASDEKLMTNRSIISQVADSLLAIEGIEASFVVARISERTVGVSARSNGSINVHVIMEKMHGSGHFTAAALQRDNTSVEAVTNELKSVIEKWLDAEGQL